MEAYESDTCNICAESYTRQRRKQVSCPKCQYKCCINCLRQQCISNNDPMCVNPECRAIFPQSFLYDTFPTNFVKGDLRKHRANVLIEQEMALMNSTMPYVKSRIKKREAENKLDELQKQQKELNNKITLLRQEAKSFEELKKKTIKDLNIKRNEELNNFLKLINPIVQEYMQKNSIDIIIDKKNIFMAKSKNDITEDILEIINLKIK